MSALSCSLLVSTHAPNLFFDPPARILHHPLDLRTSPAYLKCGLAIACFCESVVRGGGDRVTERLRARNFVRLACAAQCSADRRSDSTRCSPCCSPRASCLSAPMQTASTYPLAAAAVPASASASAAAAALAGASSNTIDVDTHRAFARYKRRTKTRATKIDGAANGVANGARGAAADGSTAMNDGAAAAASTAAAAASSAKSAAAADDDEKQREEDDAADSDDDEDDSHRLLSAAHIRALLSRHIKTAEDLLSIVPEKWPDSSGGSDSEGFLPRKLLVQLQEIISSDSRGAPHSLLNEFEAAFGCASSDPSSAASGAALSSFSPLAPLSTGNAHIDSLLQGGLWPGEVTEIVGSTCTGKTQV